MTPRQSQRVIPDPAKPLTSRVLVVDDDSFQLELISGLLRGLGLVDVTTAASGESALRLMAGQRFDLMLLDLHMPGMDGFKFMEAVADAGFAGSLVIVSGQSADVMHAASLVAKLRRFTLLGSVAKPVGRSALSALLAQRA